MKHRITGAYNSASPVGELSPADPPRLDFHHLRLMAKLPVSLAARGFLVWLTGTSDTARTLDDDELCAELGIDRDFLNDIVTELASVGQARREGEEWVVWTV